MVLDSVAAQFRQEAADGTLNELFALEDKIDREANDEAATDE